MSKICENCKNCPLLKDNGEVLLKVYSYGNEDDHTFDTCINKNGVMTNNKDPNVLCYLRHTYKNLHINWSSINQFYEENKDAFGKLGIK